MHACSHRKGITAAVSAISPVWRVVEKTVVLPLSYLLWKEGEYEKQ